MSVTDLFSVKDRVAIVTGAASGLGLAMAKGLAEAGAIVVVADVNVAGVDQAVAEIRQVGGHAEGAVLDVSDRQAVRDTFGRVAADHGRLDIVIANAGVTAGPGYLAESGEITSVDDASWDRVIGINMTGVLVTIQSAARQMKKQGSGRIVAISSVAGLKSQSPCGYAYVASKAAVVNIVRQAAADLARFGICVNGIAPGPFRTSIASAKPKEGSDVEKFLAGIPMRRVADPLEMVGPMLLLCSDASSFMTGVTVPVDGGLMAL